jgi:hypothetical protein
MSEKFCSTCKKNLNSQEFIHNSREYSTCNICRNAMNIKRRKNICEICGVTALFNFYEEKKGIRCKVHIKKGMIDVIHKKCIICNKKRPCFNFKDQIKPTHCKDCSQIGMVDIINSKCIICKTKQSTFNFKDEIKPTHCKDCSTEDMVDIKNSKCVICKYKVPCFNFESEDKATHCKDCSEEGMIDIKSKKCIVCNKTRPHFNFEGQLKATHCKKCSEEGMIDIKSKKCIVCNKTRPVFNFEGQLEATHCKKCSEEGMIDIKSKKCIVCNKKQPFFNFKGEDKATHCKDCSTEHMIDIKNKMCIVCKKKNPNFNFKEKPFPTHCKDCSEEGMIDIKSRKCIVCNITACFGYINQPKTHCSRHKLPLMFKKKYYCQNEDCNEIAEYGLEEPSHCFTHQKENELCLLGQKCKQCHRENELCNKDHICLTYCKPTETTLTIKKIIKKKEALVLAYLDNNLKTDLIPNDDKIIDNSCVKRRPDRLYDCGTHFVIIEVDENQHGFYTDGCSLDKISQENRRMIQILEALSMGIVPVIFIRFNPDNFRVKEKLMKVNMQKRLEILLKWVEYSIKYDVEKFNGSMINVKYLFYDEYDETELEFEKIEV